MRKKRRQYSSEFKAKAALSALKGDEITGNGMFQAENALMSPATDRVRKHFDLKAAGVPKS